MIDKHGAAKWIDFLNSLVAMDRDAITALVNARVKCNAVLGEHPTVQTGLKNKSYRVGLLGILNGFHGVSKDGWGSIAAVFDKNEKIIKFVPLEKIRRSGVPERRIGKNPRVPDA